VEGYGVSGEPSTGGDVVMIKKTLILLCIIAIIVTVSGFVLWELQLVDIGARAFILLNVLNLIRIWIEWRKKQTIQEDDSSKSTSDSEKSD